MLTSRKLFRFFNDLPTSSHFQGKQLVVFISRFITIIFSDGVWCQFCGEFIILVFQYFIFFLVPFTSGYILVSFRLVLKPYLLQRQFWSEYLCNSSIFFTCRFIQNAARDRPCIRVSFHRHAFSVDL